MKINALYKWTRSFVVAPLCHKYVSWYYVLTLRHMCIEFLYKRPKLFHFAFSQVWQNSNFVMWPSYKNAYVSRKKFTHFVFKCTNGNCEKTTKYQMLWFLPCFRILDRVMIHLNRADMEITPDVSCYSVVQVTLLISRKKPCSFTSCRIKR